MKIKVLRYLKKLLGRRLIWRIGRSIYLEARSDCPNYTHNNGEEYLQFQILSNLKDSNEIITIFDIGANIGDWSIPLLNKCKNLNLIDNINLHTFEPFSLTYSELNSKLDKKNLRNLVVSNNFAISNKNGNAKIYITGNTAGTNSLHKDAMKNDQEFVEIKTKKLDSYCSENDIDSIQFVKCDTEGHDMEVIYGSSELLANEKIMVFQFEYNHRWIYSRHYLKDVFDLLESTNYVIGKLTPDVIEIFDKWHPEIERFFEGNYLILHPKALGWLNISYGTFDKSNTYS